MRWTNQAASKSYRGQVVPFIVLQQTLATGLKWQFISYSKCHPAQGGASYNYYKATVLNNQRKGTTMIVKGEEEEEMQD